MNKSKKNLVRRSGGFIALVWLSAILSAQAQQPPLQTCTAEEVRATERWWLFGDNGGIDFDIDGTTGTLFLGSQTAVEGSTVVTDTSGQLLFWSNGQQVFDRNSSVMPNGDGLLGHPSATQTVAAFPSLTTPGQYFVVTTSTNVGDAPNGNLSYSVVDMSLNGGLGDVVAAIKNVPLGSVNTASEALTAVPNADGTGFWVLTYTNNSPDFLAYAFDGDGPVTGDPVISTMPSNHHDWFGTINISADLASMVLLSGMNDLTGTIRLLQFDAASGQAVEELQWALPDGADSGNRGYSADFSPAGDYVYVSKIFGGGQLYRYDIANNATGPDVEASMEQLGAIGNAGGQVRRAPDGRMYVAANNDTSLSVVNDPDNATEPGFETAGVPLPAGAQSRFGLPQTVTGCAEPVDLLDFGDAPESYDTLLDDGGARHVLLDFDLDTNTSSLMLGSLVDSEPDGFPSAGADGDDSDNIGDEDAFGVMPPININLDEYTVEVPVHNTTGGDAVLAGWIDFNRNDQFDPDEAVTATVADGETMATLSWTGLSLGGQFGGTYARLRIAPAGEIDADTPAGEAMGGEVEDYTVQFVDLPPPFSDCPVNQEPPSVDFTIQERWRTPNTAGERTLPYQTPVVGDLYGTGEIVAVVAADNGFVGFGAQPQVSARSLHIFRGSDGALLDTIPTPRFNWFGHAVVAIADADGDGVGEVFMKAAHHDEVAAANRGRLFAYKYDGSAWNQWWVSDTRYDYGNNSANTNNDRRSGHALSIADFNGDGIPEIFIGSQIFNAQTGVRLAARPAADSAGCVLATCIQGSTVAVDMDDDGQLELVAGNVVYKVDITNTGGAAGNSMTIWRQADAVAAMGDGFTSVADVDVDGDPDVVIVRAAGGTNDNNSHLFVWDGQTDNVLGAVHAGQLGISGSQPMVGDIDGDDIPEIVFVTSNQLNAYKYEAGTGLVQKWSLGTNDQSGQTSFALFDFNSDGSRELVYRDETDLRIMDGSGANAVDLATFPCFSGTRAEMPVVAALDGTSEARILVTCSVTNEVDGNARGSLRAYETASFPWANARPVWNQETYFVAHVNDDLTIPANQFPHWTGFDDPEQQCSEGVNRPLNAFQQQVTDLDPNNGCPVVCAPVELGVEKSIIAESGELDGMAEPGEELTYSIRVRNTGGVDAIDVEVNEIVPDNTSYQAAGSDAWSCADGSGPGTACDFVIGTVPADGHVDLLYRLRVDDPIPPGITGIANAVALNGEDPPDCPPETDPACAVIPTEPQTVVAKALSGENGQFDGQAEAGEVLTYTITLQNHGGTADTNVVVNEIVPEQTTTAAGNQNANGALGAWSCADGAAPGAACDLTVATIAAGETVMLTFMVQVDDPLPDGVTDIANAVALNGEDPVPCPPASPQCVTIPTEPALSVAKTLMMEDGEFDGVAEPGETLVYELRVSNSGGSPAVDEFLREIVPQDTTFLADPASSPGWSCPDNSSNPAVCDLFFDIDAGETLNFLFAVQVADPLPEGSTRIANSVGLGGNPTPCPPPGVHCVVIPTVPDVVIDKQLTGENGQLGGEAEAGELLTYTITLTNSGGAPATDFEVIDQLDPNVTFVSADNGGVHNGAAGEVQWTVDVPGADDVDGPGMVALTVVVEVVAPIPKGVTAIANTAFNPDTGPPNCQASPPPPNCTEIQTEPPESSVMLSKALTNAPNPIESGSVLTYTITATNTGAVTLTDVVVSDPRIDPGSVTCASVGPGETCQLTGEYIVTQADVEAGQIDNSATVTSPDPFDTDAPPLQDMDTITTPIEPLTVPFMHPLNRVLLGLMVMLLGLVAIARAGVRP